MDYLTVKETGSKWGITGRMVTHYCVADRIPGAIKKGNLWLVPADAEKPRDGRYKDNAVKGGEKPRDGRYKDNAVKGGEKHEAHIDN